jgi:hypothetical protein
MKYGILFACLFFFGNALNAQYTWCVSIQGKVKLRHVEENREGNVVLLSLEELNKAGYFHINFSRSDTAMRRTIFVDDSAGSGMQNWEEVKKQWKIPTSQLKTLIDKGGDLSFYYTEIPRDINKAMVVKVRPVHLCTVKRIKK